MPWRWVALALVIVCGSVGAAFWWRARRDAAELALAERELSTGQFAEAEPRLIRLAARQPGQPQVEFALGRCEYELGHREAALAAWLRIPSRSAFASIAAMWRIRLAMKYGRLAAIDGIATDDLDDALLSAPDLRRSCEEILRYQGRDDEVRALLRHAWRKAPDQVAILRSFWQLDYDPYPVDGVRQFLDTAERTAAIDDRVWLAQAALALRTGDWAEAARRLDVCLKRRRRDPAVWRARLEWAVATNQLSEARRAVHHLSPQNLPSKRALQLTAWLASNSGDAARELRALTTLRELDIGNVAAINRLAELAFRAGDTQTAAGLRAEQAKLDTAHERYQTLLGLDNAADNASELGQLAEVLGRRFEARCWWSIAARRSVDTGPALAALARVEREQQDSQATGERIFAELVTEFDAALRNQQPQRSETAAIVPSFADDAAASGLRFTYDNGRSPIRHLPETMGGGVALLDYDGDGWLDVYAIGGGVFPPPSGSSPAPNGDRLFHNRGNGQFEDVTERSGLAALPGGYGHGVAVGDFDNDGHPDIFVTRWRSYALLHNRGDGRFENVTDAAGLGGDRDWPTSAVFADLDGDGDLDLYVCHYLKWNAEHPEPCRQPETGLAYYCDPRMFEPLPDHLFRNDVGRFTDVTAEAGIADRDGRGLGVVAADLDGDGLIDLFVANDMSANFLYHNRGGMRFEETAHGAGVAGNADGGYQAGMGIACGDLDGDGLPDLAVTNFYGQSTTLFQNLGRGIFSDHTAAVGLLVPSRSLLGFGVSFLDANNDGRLDLISANGHVNDGRPIFPFAMPAQLLLGSRGGLLVDVSANVGPALAAPRVGRGMAIGDLDNDGQLDAVLLVQNGPLVYLHNRMTTGHFLTFQLIGTKSNRDAVGARVTVTAGESRQVGWRLGGGSYASASDGRLHFGLNGATKAERVEVIWPSGAANVYHDLAVDRGWTLKEGHGEPLPLAGFGIRK